MKEFCTLNFAISRRLFGTALAAVMLALFSIPSGSETVQVTLYYPAPVGVYTKMQANGYLQVSTSVSTSGAAIIVGSFSSAVFGRTGYGILGRSSLLYLAPASTNYTCTAAAASMRANIWLLARSGAIRFRDRTPIYGVCNWRSGASSPLYDGLPTDSSRVFMVARGTSASKILSNTGADGMWCRGHVRSSGY